MTRTTRRILQKSLPAKAILFALLASSCGPATPPPDMGIQDRPLDDHPELMRHPDPPGGPNPTVANDHLTGPEGQRASISDDCVAVRYPDNKEFRLAGSAFHPPPGDRGIVAILPTSLYYLPNGTLLIGVADGTLTAMGSDAKRLWSVGLRGAVTGIAEAGNGTLAVTTRRGVLALVGEDGKVRWERQITAEALAAPIAGDPTMILTASARGLFAYSRSGEELFTHASGELYAPCQNSYSECSADAPPGVWMEGGVIRVNGLSVQRTDSHPPVASLTPTYPFTWKKVLDGTIVSALPNGERGAHALVTHRKKRTDYDWSDDDHYDVVSIDGDKQKRASVPELAPKKEVFVDGTEAGYGPVFVDSLVAGPNGKPWVIARRMNAAKTSTGDGLLGRFGGAAIVFEIDSGKATERRDMTAAFAAHWLSTPLAATPSGSPALLCFGEEEPACAVHDGASFRLAQPPGQIGSLHRIGDAVWMLTPDGTAFRADGKVFDAFEVVLGLDGMSLERVAGVSERDMWAASHREYTLLHREGAAWREVSVPFGAQGLFARAADDVWYGAARFDGKSFRVVGGAPHATTGFAASKDDVWLGDRNGLFHGTAPGPAPIDLARTPPGDTVSLTPTPIPVGALESAFSAVSTTISVRGESPLDAASNVAVSPSGVVWMLAPDRVVELGSLGKGATVRFTGREGFGKWAVPEGKGKGLLLQRDEVRGMTRRDEIRRIDGNVTAAIPVQLDKHDAVAASVGPSGAAWILGRPAEFERSSLFRNAQDERARQGLTSYEDMGAHAIARTETGSYRPVLGLPAASYTDVSTAADGGAWFAGALQQGPSGEGILVHAKGPLGKDGVERFRARATLFAVAATGVNEAWAVGAGGLIAHAKDGALTWYSYPSGEWLRSVLAIAPDDVWIGGDGGTLLHWDGASFHPVHHALGLSATFTGIAATTTELWAVGPTGILLLKRK